MRQLFQWPDLRRFFRRLDLRRFLQSLDPRRFTRWYGAGPLHLLTMLGCFALAGYAAAELLPNNAIGIPIWFAGAVIGHDLILMPIYTVADRSAMAVFRHRRPQLPAVPWINYLRVPAALSGMLLLIWFPLIFRLPRPLHRHDNPVTRPVPVALARRDRRAVPAVRHGPCRAAAPRPRQTEDTKARA